MAETRNQNEPTMEEILASIRRIIVEEDELPPMTQAAEATVPASVVDAAETLPPSPRTRPRFAGYEAAAHAIPDYAPEPSSWPPPVQEAILDVAEPARDDPMPESMQPATRPRLPRFGHRAPPLKPANAEPRSIIEAAVSASVASLTRAATLSHAARQPELPLGAAGRTLEDMVRELMRPHLQEWLDAHLPRLVERVVRDEIGRLVRDIQER
jgi:hypothetical protein